MLFSQSLSPLFSLSVSALSPPPPSISIMRQIAIVALFVCVCRWGRGRELCKVILHRPLPLSFLLLFLHTSPSTPPPNP